MSWFLLFIAAALLAVTAHGLVTGSIMAKHGMEFDRIKSPKSFWALVIGYTLIAALAAYMGIMEIWVSSS
jgi:hypothetical protein